MSAQGARSGSRTNHKAQLGCRQLADGGRLTRLAVRMTVNGRVEFRQLTGVELMRIIGWHESFFTNVSAEKHRCLSSLAGNAFSGFAAMAVCIAPFTWYNSFAALGCTPSGADAVDATVDLSFLDSDESDDGSQ